tara:strand:+ start:108 stop:806 length:699 start_codon:yes stop_codon:yes gene_type:complete
MYKKKRILAIIPARKGSKGLKNKNIKKLNNKLLFLHSLHFAEKCKFIDRICITTDSPKIINNINNYKKNKKIFLIKRSKKLSSDTASANQVILDVLLKQRDIKFDYFILLEPTSPLRLIDDIKKALGKLILTGRDNINSVSENINCSPEFLYSMNKEGIIKTYLNKNNFHIRRQDIKHKTFFLNGTFYISKISKFLKYKSLFNNSLGYLTKKQYSFEIDDELDFKILKYLMK